MPTRSSAESTPSPTISPDTPEEAAELAQDSHSDYTWEHVQTAEFDARLYVTLDREGNEIEATQVGDF